MHQTHDHAMLALPPPHSESRSTTASDGTSRHASYRYRRLLVASDGGLLSRGALALAALLARRDDTPVDVVSVVRTGAPRARGGAERRAARAHRRMDGHDPRGRPTLQSRARRMCPSVRFAPHRHRSPGSDACTPTLDRARSLAARRDPGARGSPIVQVAAPPRSGRRRRRCRGLLCCARHRTAARTPGFR